MTRKTPELTIITIQLYNKDQNLKNTQKYTRVQNITSFITSSPRTTSTQVYTPSNGISLGINCKVRCKASQPADP